MTGPSSGDRPAEEPRSICGVEHEDTEGYWTCTLAAGHRSPHGAFDYESQDLLAAWPATPPAVRTGDDAATVEQDALPWHVDPLDSHRVVDRDGYGVATAFAAPDAARIVALANTALSTPPPVSGTATRDDVARELRRHSASARLVDNGSTYITCRCGFAIGSYLHGWGDPASHDAWELHRADVPLALGGSQPAVQPKYGYLLDSLRSVGTHAAEPAPHHDDDRPITQYTEQGDDGLRALVERIRELAPSAVKAAEHQLGITR